MGIPAYFRYLVTNYDNLLKAKPDIPISRLFLDLNCAIHPCVREVMKEYQSLRKHEMERKACRSVLDYIIYLVKNSQPVDLLYIAIDGVAPRAKMVQQRHRRFKSIQEFQNQESLKQKFQQDYSASERWDTNAITPGTSFMELLSKYLQHEIPSCEDLSSISVILSDTNQEGEGEHKILQYLKSNPQETSKSDVIYGLDADLIMLSMASQKPNIYLLREKVEFGNVIKKDSDSFPELVYLDIDLFRKYLLQDMELHGLTRSTLTSVVQDYIFLCFMLGNDFLPHPPSLSIRNNGINNLQSLYCEIHKELGYDLIYQDDSMTFQIRREFLVRMWEVLSQHEESEIIKHEKKLMKPHYITEKTYDTPYDRELAIVEHYPVFHRDLEKKINIGRPGWRKRYYRQCFGVTSESEIEKLVDTYCKTLMWTMYYYLDTCPDWSWYYPYRHCPLFVDLHKYAPSDFTVPKSTTKPMTPYQQLLLVLPQTSFSLLPKSYQKYLQQPLSDLTPFYPTEYNLDTYHKNRLWECLPILPNFELSDLGHISKKSLTRDEKARIKKEGVIIIK